MDEFKKEKRQKFEKLLGDYYSVTHCDMNNEKEEQALFDFLEQTIQHAYMMNY